MELDTPLVLPTDARLVAVATLPQALREQLGGDPEDVALLRSGSRTPSRLLDRDGAALLAEFTAPTTIVDAVLRFSAARDADPKQVLSDAFDLLRACVNSKLIVRADSAEAQAIAASAAVGDTIGGATILRVVQVVEDTELYEAERHGERVAIKLGRATRAAAMRAALGREAALLEEVAGAAGAPQLLDRGIADGRPYLLLRWCPGIAVSAAADRLRWDSQGGDWRRRLHHLGVAVLDAYCELEARSILHGDVQPQNILVAGTETIAVIDFGLARVDRPGHPLASVGNGAVPLFCEPEAAAALADGAIPAPITAAGEQYRLGALLYLVLTGQPYLDPPAERDALYRKILDDPPLPFVDRGFEAWPAVEAVLARALAKDPKDRFPSLAALRQAFAAASPPEARGLRVSGPAAALIERCLGELAWGSALLRDGPPEAPTATLNLGGAGFAAFLLRLAELRDDPDLLALADAWSTRTLTAARRETSGFAYYNEALEMTPAVVSRASPFHHAPGLWWVHARIAGARGDRSTVRESAAGYLEAVSTLSDPPGPSGAPPRPDPTLGRPGLLLAGALLLAELTADEPESAALRQHLEGELAWAEGLLASLPPIAACAAFPTLGMAHGWAGLLYMIMRAEQALGRPPGVLLSTRLDELAALAEPAGDGLLWPGSVTIAGHKEPAMDRAPGWCAGSAGHTHLFALAHEHLGDPRYLELAAAAATAAIASPDTYADLCCGLAGRGYAALRLYQRTGDEPWLRAAEELALRALPHADATLRPLSLVRGRFGVALLLADLDDPGHAHAPLHRPPLR